MGLDGVELVLAIEEEFGIEIEDGETEGICTVGDLQQFVIDRIGPIRSGRCKTQAVFHTIRRAIRSLSGAPRRSIRPKSNLVDVGLDPKALGGSLWRQIGSESALSLPRLGFQPHVRLTLTLLCISIILAGFAPAFLEEGNEWRGVVLLTLPLSFFIVLRLLKLKAVQSWRRSIPVGIETIGGLATAVAALNDDRLSALREKDIELAREKIRTIVSAQLGVPLELVRPEAELIRDLGMD